MKTPFFPVTSAATDVAMQMARTNAEYWDYLARQAKGTPVAPLFDMASQMQHSTLQSLEAMTEVIGNGAFAKTASKKDVKEAVKPIAKTMKKVVDAQADMLVEASAATAKASAKSKKAAKKAGKSAKSGDAIALYDDLTAVQGIGPATMRKLHKAGIRSITDLAEVSVGALNDVIEKANIRALGYDPKDWIREAKKMAKNAA